MGRVTQRDLGARPSRIVSEVDFARVYVRPKANFTSESRGDGSRERLFDSADPPAGVAFDALEQILRLRIP
eukprot:scaffold731_cov261-Pinguiococcus_pyrenoidosus.AAC.40